MNLLKTKDIVAGFILKQNVFFIVDTMEDAHCLRSLKAEKWHILCLRVLFEVLLNRLLKRVLQFFKTNINKISANSLTCSSLTRLVLAELKEAKFCLTY